MQFEQVVLRPNPKADWTTPHKNRTEPVLLDFGLLAKHLSSLPEQVGVRRDANGTTRWITFDIDDKGRGHASVRARFEKLKCANPTLKFVTTRSSNSGGLHVHLFLDSYVANSTVTLFARELLARVGESLRHGWFEVFPSTNGLRLPLGNTSVLLDDNLRVVSGTKLEQLRAFIHLAETRTNTAELLSLKHDVEEAGWSPWRRTRNQRMSLRSVRENRTGRERKRIYKSVKEDLSAPLVEYGTRWSTFKRIVVRLAKYSSLSAAQIERRINKWTKLRGHKSRDLKKDPEGTRASMLTAAKAIVRMIRNGDDRRASTNAERERAEKGISRNSESSLSLSLRYVQLKASTSRRGAWKHVAAAMAKPEDLSVFNHAHPWLQRIMPVLAGLLRHMLRRRRRVTLPSDLLLRIATGNPAPDELQPLMRGRIHRLAAYRVMLRYARKAKWLKRIHRGREGVHADIYEITMS